MKKPDAIVILTPGFPASASDSTCLPARQAFVRALAVKYPLIKVIVFSFQYPFETKTYSYHGAEVITFNGRNKGNIRRGIVWAKTWNQFRKTRAGYNIKGILSFWMGECALVGNFFSKQYGIKHCTWILGQDARKGNRFISWIRPSAHDLVALSDFIKEEVNNNYRVMPEHVIPVGIDTGLYRNDPAKDIDIMGAGSLIPLKQFDVFINVITELSKVHKGLKCIICGEGAEKERLSEMIISSGLAGTIEMKGKLCHSEVIHYMQRSKIFLHTSSYEGFGTVCAEALYAGCHVISFCKPMKNDIRQWHIASSMEEMCGIASTILADPATSYQKVLISTADECAEKLMELFL